MNTEIIFDHKRLRDAVKWVIDDAMYKAPEQINAAMAARWVGVLSRALKREDGK